jgi:O-antigen/teichoic acid export membrane protein
MVNRNIIANYIGQFYSFFIGIVILPLYLEYLSPEGYGLVGFFTVFVSLMMLLDVGLTSTLSRESARLRDSVNNLIKLKELTRSIEFVFILISIAMLTIVYISSDLIVENWLIIETLSHDIVNYCIILMSIIMVIKWYVGIYQGIIVGLERQVWLNVFKIAINSLRFIGSFLLIKYISNSILSFFIYQLFVIVIEYLIVRRKIYSLLPKTNNLPFSINPIKKVAKFALGMAYTSSIWIVYIQLDKLLLLHYIPLSEYGFFTLIAVISGAIIQSTAPVSLALLPRLSFLLKSNKKDEMLSLYHKGTKIVSILVMSVVTVISLFSYELLYAWTGNKEAAEWSEQILVWYVIGSGILAIGAFQYYLQYAYGELKYHIRINTIFPIIALPIIFFSVESYGALGASIAWFSIQLVSFIFWPAFIHNKFAKGHHKDWLFKDIFPSVLMSSIFVVVINTINPDLLSYGRLGIFLVLGVVGMVLLLSCALMYKEARGLLRDKIISLFLLSK